VDEDKADLDLAKAQLVKDKANVVYAKISHERQDQLFAEDSTSHDAADRRSTPMIRRCDRQSRRRSGRRKGSGAEGGTDKSGLHQHRLAGERHVVSRNVTAGQTVAASFQTPTLFLIATD